jgi:hypothetical protein
LNALQGHDIAPFKHVLDEIEKALRALMISQAESIMEDESGTLEVLVKNLIAVFDYLPVSFTKAALKGFADRGVALAQAYNRYKPNPSRPNTTAFNKATLAWLEFKLAVQDQSDGNKLFIRALLKGLAEPLTQHTVLQATICRESEETLIQSFTEYAKIGYGSGLKDGSSWKEGLKEKTSVKEVLNQAFIPKSGLLSGPGPKIMQGSEVLEKVRSCRMEEMACEFNLSSYTFVFRVRLVWPTPD